MAGGNADRASAVAPVGNVYGPRGDGGRSATARSARRMTQRPRVVCRPKSGGLGGDRQCQLRSVGST